MVELISCSAKTLIAFHLDFRPTGFLIRSFSIICHKNDLWRKSKRSLSLRSLGIFFYTDYNENSSKERSNSHEMSYKSQILQRTIC